jgi:hypothetical protein
MMHGNMNINILRYQKQELSSVKLPVVNSVCLMGERELFVSVFIGFAVV